jgi:polyphosphate kinase 2 (PPK2 family)
MRSTSSSRRSHSRSSGEEVERARRIDEIVRLERMLAKDGLLVLDFSFLLKQQKKRLKALARDPRTAWRVTKDRWKELDRYDDSLELRRRTLQVASTPETPRTFIESPDPQECAFQVGETLLAAVRAKLALLVIAKRFRKRSLILAFEGWDAAGKGGAIRRVTRALDARQYTTISGASGVTSRVTGGSRSSTAPGTGACSSSASRASPARRSVDARRGERQVPRARLGARDDRRAARGSSRVRFRSP